jgi:hypothetical protein
MNGPTAKEAAREYVRLSDGEYETTRAIGSSFASLLPDDGIWTAVKQDKETYLVVLDSRSSALWLARVEPRERNSPGVGVALIPLKECRLSVVDFENQESRNYYVMHREWTIAFARGEPSSLTLKAAWVGGDSKREPERVEQFGNALSAAMGWELAPVPPDFAA